MTITTRTRKDGKKSYTVQVFNKHIGKKTTVGTFHRKSDAEAAERQAKVEIQTAGIVKGFRDITVGQLIDQHMKAKSARLKPSTVANYKLFLRRFKDFVGKDKSVNAVTTQDVEAFVSDLVQRGLASSVVSLNVNAVSALFKTAIRYGYLQVNPVDSVDNRPKNKGVREMRALSIEEHKLLVDAVSPQFRLMVMVWPYIAARPSEMYGLQTRDFDPKEKTLRVERQYRNPAYQALKHDAKPRVLHLDERTARLLEQQLKQNKDKGPESPLFPSYRGGPIDRSWFPSKVFKDAVTKAGIDGDVTPHSLRHTGATWLLESGASVMYVAKHLGHSNPSITMRTYAQLLDSVDKTAMSRLQVWYDEVQKAETTEEARAVGEAIRTEKAIEDAATRRRQILGSAWQRSTSETDAPSAITKGLERIAAATSRLHSKAKNQDEASKQDEQ